MLILFLALLTKAKIDTDTDTAVFRQIPTDTDRTLNCRYRITALRLHVHRVSNVLCESFQRRRVDAAADVDVDRCRVPGGRRRTRYAGDLVVVRQRRRHAGDHRRTGRRRRTSAAVTSGVDRMQALVMVVVEDERTGQNGCPHAVTAAAVVQR